MSDGGAQLIRFGPYVNPADDSLYQSIKVIHYIAGTTTNKTVWTDEARVTPASQPVVGDLNGKVQFYADGDYDFVVTTSDDIELETFSNMKVTSDTGGLWEGNQGTAYPAVTSLNTGQQFTKIVGGAIQVFGINDGTAFRDLAAPIGKGADIASSAALTIPNDGGYHDVTGTTTVTSINTKRVGATEQLHFDGILTLTHDATALILPDGLNILTSAGDEYTFVEYSTGNWRMTTRLNTISADIETKSTTRDLTRGLIVVPNAGTPLSLLDIDADEVTLQDSTNIVKVLQSVNLTADMTASGVNGLDVGAEASNTFYYTFVIYNPTTDTTASLLSLSSTAPTMPTDYTFKALVSVVRNNGSSNFIPFTQSGKETTYDVVQTIKDGSFSTSAWTAESLSSIIPPTAKKVKLALGGSAAETGLGLSPLASGNAGSYDAGSSGGSTFDYGIMPTARGHWFTALIKIANLTSIYYYTNTANSTLVAVGYEL